MVAEHSTVKKRKNGTETNLTVLLNLKPWPETTLGPCAHLIRFYEQANDEPARPGVLHSRHRETIQLHSVNLRSKVRMVQKILNKVVGAKYITILRAW